MNAGGNRSGTRFTPRMADAATQTYLYGSSAPTPWKANHRMGAAGGGLRDSHLLRGGACERSYQRFAGIYERTGDDTVTVEFKVSILRGPMTREEVRFDYRYERECLVREKIIKIEVALLSLFSVVPTETDWQTVDRTNLATGSFTNARASPNCGRCRRLFSRILFG